MGPLRERECRVFGRCAWCLFCEGAVGDGVGGVDGGVGDSEEGSAGFGAAGGGGGGGYADAAGGGVEECGRWGEVLMGGGAVGVGSNGWGTDVRG